MKLLGFIIFISLIISGCSQRLVYHQYSDYSYNEDEKKCNPVHHEYRSILKINTKSGFIKASIFGEEQKFKIKSYEYQYKFMSLFHKKSDRKSIRIECENGYKFYIEYGMFGILTIPDDGDEDECDDTIFYDLI